MIELSIEGLDAVRETFARLVPDVKQQVLNGMAQVAFDTAQKPGRYPHADRCS
jgi:hypothetical protein